MGKLHDNHQKVEGASSFETQPPEAMGYGVLLLPFVVMIFGLLSGLASLFVERIVNNSIKG